MQFNLLPLAAAVALALNPLLVLAKELSTPDLQDQNIEKITVMGKYTVSKTIDTATGLGLSLMETPQSVSILTAERIQDQALNTVVDVVNNAVVNNAVGLSSSKTDNVRNGFNARGFSVQNYQIDGVPLSWSLGGMPAKPFLMYPFMNELKWCEGQQAYSQVPEIRLLRLIWYANMPIAATRRVMSM